MPWRCVLSSTMTILFRRNDELNQLVCSRCICCFVIFRQVEAQLDDVYQWLSRKVVPVCQMKCAWERRNFPVSLQDKVWMSCGLEGV